jgi:hypothetical protein
LNKTSLVSIAFRRQSFKSMINNYEYNWLLKCQMAECNQQDSASISLTAVGSCAMAAREPGQSWKKAAFIGYVRGPQTAWPTLQSAALFSLQLSMQFQFN